MSDLVYFEYALVLPEERYLVEVQARNHATGEVRGHDELERIAKEVLVSIISQGRSDLVKELKPTAIAELDAQRLKKVEQLLNRPDCTVFLVE
jgi:hypothetical protein